MEIKKILILIVLAVLILSGCGPLGPKPTPQASPTISFALNVLPPATATQVFPATMEDSVFTALAFYRQQGFESFKSTWLTDEFSARTQYADFLAAMVNNAATSPSALMGWEIQKSEPELGGTLPQGTMKALVKTSYQGGVSVCRWLFLSPPQLTGNHWRISENQIATCDGAAPVAAGGTPVPVGATVQPAPASQTTPVATSSAWVWYPCPGAPASAIQIGSKVYVNPFPPLGIWAHWEPNTESEAMGLLNPGDVINITGGPTCASGVVFWKMTHKEELTPGSGSYEEYDAWVAEMENATNYYLLPCPASGACGGGFTPVRTASSPLEPD